MSAAAAPLQSMAVPKPPAEGASPFQMASGPAQSSVHSGQAALHGMSLNRPPAMSASSEGTSPVKHSTAGRAGKVAGSSLNGESDSEAEDSSEEEVRIVLQ